MSRILLYPIKIIGRHSPIQRKKAESVHRLVKRKVKTTSRTTRTMWSRALMIFSRSPPLTSPTTTIITIIIVIIIVLIAIPTQRIIMILAITTIII